jgi:hypothetical protein
MFELQLLIAPVQHRIPAAEQGVAGLAETGLEPGLGPGPPRVQRTCHPLVEQPGGTARLEGQIPRPQVPAATECQTLTQPTLKPQPGRATAEEQLLELQMLRGPTARQLERALQLPGSGLHPTPGGPGQLHGLVLAAQGAQGKFQASLGCAGTPAQLPELKRPRTRGPLLLPSEPKAAVNLTGELAGQAQQALEGAEGEDLTAQPTQPLLSSPVAIEAHGHRTGPLNRAESAIQLELAPVGAQAEASGHPKPLARRSQAHQRGIGQAQPHIQPGRPDAGWQPTQHPELALRIGLQFGPYPRQAHLEHGQALAQAGQGIQAHRHGPDGHPGALCGARANGGGARLKATPTPTLISPQPNGMAQHLAQGLLQPGLPVLVGAPQGLVSSPQPHHRGAPGEGQTAHQPRHR